MGANSDPPAANKPPPAGQKQVARSAKDLNTSNLIVSPSFVLVVLDQPDAADDTFTLTYPPKTRGGKGKVKTKSRDDALQIDADHKGIRFDEIPDDAAGKRKYKLVQHRKKAAHTVFTETGTNLLIREGEKPPLDKKKQYFALRIVPGRASDRDLRGDFVDFSAIKVKEPITD